MLDTTAHRLKVLRCVHVNDVFMTLICDFLQLQNSILFTFHPSDDFCRIGNIYFSFLIMARNKFLFYNCMKMYLDNQDKYCIYDFVKTIKE